MDIMFIKTVPSNSWVNGRQPIKILLKEFYEICSSSLFNRFLSYTENMVNTVIVIT